MVEHQGIFVFPNTTYNNKNNNNNNSDEDLPCASLVCAICHDAFERACSLQCGHTFCANCIRECFQRERSCPCCRRQFAATASLVPNLVARDVISELREFCQRSKQEKNQLEAIKRDLLAWNQTLQASLDVQRLSLEDSQSSKIALELRCTQDLSRLEAELDKAKDDLNEAKDFNSSLQSKIQQLEQLKDEGHQNYQACEFALREEVRELTQQLQRVRDERDSVRCNVEELRLELETLRQLEAAVETIKIQQLRSEIDNLEQQKKEWQEAVETLHRANHRLEQGVTQLKYLSQIMFPTQCRVQKGFYQSQPPPRNPEQALVPHGRPESMDAEQLLERFGIALACLCDVLAEIPSLVQTIFVGQEPLPLRKEGLRKFLHVLYAIWLLWIFQFVCLEAFSRIIPWEYLSW